MGYTPQVIDGKYVLFAAQGRECPICKKIMIKKLQRYYFENSFFPAWVEMNQDAQMKRAGLVYVGGAKVDDEYICEECEKAGKADFKCELCGERHPTSEIQERFGDPADFLCKSCYETTTAKVWEEKCDELQEEHKYDYE
jgi:hypothetical protein